MSRALWFLGGACFGAACLWAWRALKSREDKLCGLCHEMRPYVESYASSKHARQADGVVPRCTECHPFSLSAALKDIWGHFRGKEPGGDYKPPRGACERCHRELLRGSPSARVEHYLYKLRLYEACSRCHGEEELFHAEREESDQANGPFPNP